MKTNIVVRLIFLLLSFVCMAVVCFSAFTYFKALQISKDVSKTYIRTCSTSGNHSCTYIHWDTIILVTVVAGIAGVVLLYLAFCSKNKVNKRSV